MRLENAKNRDYRRIRKLFMASFPPEERSPFYFMRRNARKGTGQMLVARENEDFVGFIYLIPHLDLVYIHFFAVTPHVRGNGYGSRILQLVKEQNPGKRIFLAREPLDETAENAEQRRSRWNFYKRNGFVDLPVQIEELGYLFDAMGIGGNVSAVEYDALITNWCGKWMRRFLKMRVIEP